MNRLWIAIVMLIFAGIFSGCELYAVNSSTENYTSELENISKLMNEENFEEAATLSEMLLRKWRETAKHLDKYLYHDYVDEITEEIAALPVLARSEDNEATLSQVEQIKIQLASLKESELPYMHNVL